MSHRSAQSSQIAKKPEMLYINTDKIAVSCLKSTVLLYLLNMKREISHKKSLSAYLNELQRRGKYWFSKEQAIRRVIRTEYPLQCNSFSVSTLIYPQ